MMGTDELIALYAHMHAVDNPLPDRKIVIEIWKEIQGNLNFKYFGTFIDQRLISSCTLSVKQNFTHCCRPYGVIENGVTLSEVRRRGYASGLLKCALSPATDRKKVRRNLPVL